MVSKKSINLFHILCIQGGPCGGRMFRVQTPPTLFCVHTRHLYFYIHESNRYLFFSRPRLVHQNLWLLFHVPPLSSSQANAISVTHTHPNTHRIYNMLRCMFDHKLSFSFKIMKKLMLYFTTFVVLVLLRVVCSFLLLASKPPRRLWGQLVLEILQMEMEGLNSKYVMPERLYQLYRNYGV